MKFSPILVFAFGILFFMGVGFAGCTEDSYLNSCAECTFDDYGKMDESCRKQFEENGRNCLITQQPAILFLYAHPEQCPGLGDCQAKFSICKSMVGTGSDEGDCQSAEIKKCFQTADECIVSEVSRCNAQSSPCAMGIFILGTLAFALFASARK